MQETRDKKNIILEVDHTLIPPINDITQIKDSNGHLIAAIFLDDNHELWVKSYVPNLKLDFKEELACHKLIVDQQSDSLKLSGRLNQFNTIGTNAPQLIIQSDIDAKNLELITPKSNIVIEKNVTIKSQKSLKMSCLDLDIQGNLKANETLLLNANAVTMIPDSKIIGEKFVSIKANSLKDICGCILSNNVISVDAKDAISLRGQSSISGLKGTYVITHNMMMNDDSKIHSKDIIVTAKEKFLTHRNTQILGIKCSKLLLFSLSNINNADKKYLNSLPPDTGVIIKINNDYYNYHNYEFIKITKSLNQLNSIAFNQKEKIVNISDLPAEIVNAIDPFAVKINTLNAELHGIIEAEKIKIMTENINIYSTAIINGDKRVKIKADTCWSRGSIKSNINNGHVYLRVNGLLVNGFANYNEILSLLLSKMCVKVHTFLIAGINLSCYGLNCRI